MASAEGHGDFENCMVNYGTDVDIEDRYDLCKENARGEKLDEEVKACNESAVRDVSRETDLSYVGPYEYNRFVRRNARELPKYQELIGVGEEKEVSEEEREERSERWRKIAEGAGLETNREYDKKEIREHIRKFAEEKGTPFLERVVFPRGYPAERAARYIANYPGGYAKFRDENDLSEYPSVWEILSEFDGSWNKAVISSGLGRHTIYGEMADALEEREYMTVRDAAKIGEEAVGMDVDYEKLRRRLYTDDRILRNMGIFRPVAGGEKTTRDEYRSLAGKAKAPKSPIVYSKDLGIAAYFDEHIDFGEIGGRQEKYMKKYLNALKNDEKITEESYNYLMGKFEKSKSELLRKYKELLDEGKITKEAYENLIEEEGLKEVEESREEYDPTSWLQ